MSLIINEKDHAIDLIINRPDKRNALSLSLIEKIYNFFQQLKDKKQIENIRYIHIQAKGKHFCAGADLKWMQNSVDQSQEQNYSEALKLNQMYRAIFECSIPVVATVQGACMGGAVGLVACCDYVLAKNDAFFCLSEVRLGLIAASISPFVNAKIGFSNFNALSISAKTFDSERALSLGLVHDLINDSDNADIYLHKLFSNNAVLAMRKSKALAKEFINMDLDFHEKDKAKKIAQCRVSIEAQMYLKKFFSEK